MNYPPNDNGQLPPAQLQQPNTYYQQPMQPPPLYPPPGFYVPNPSQYQLPQWAPPATKQGKGLSVASLILVIISTLFFVVAVILGSAGFFLYLLALLLNLATVILLIIFLARR